MDPLKTSDRKGSDRAAIFQSKTYKHWKEFITYSTAARAIFPRYEKAKPKLFEGEQRRLWIKSQCFNPIR